MMPQLLNPEDRRLTPRERSMLRTIAANLQARRDGRPDLALRLEEYRGRPAAEVPPEHAEALERAFGPRPEDPT